MSKDPRSSRSHDNWFAPDPRSTGSSDKHSIQDPRSIRSGDKHSVQDPRSIRSSDKHSVQDPRSIRFSDKHSVQDPRSIRSSDKRYVQDPRSLGSFDKHVDIGSKIYKIYGSWIFRILDPGSFSDHGTSLLRSRNPLGLFVTTRPWSEGDRRHTAPGSQWYACDRLVCVSNSRIGCCGAPGPHAAHCYYNLARLSEHWPTYLDSWFVCRFCWYCQNKVVFFCARWV